MPFRQFPIISNYTNMSLFKFGFKSSKSESSERGDEEKSPKGRRKLNFAERKGKLPLTGKSIFLDIKDLGQKKSVGEDIKKLGASLEEFFNKDINYLITSNPFPKADENDPLKSPGSPSSISTPSPFSLEPSPSPAAVTKAPPPVPRGKVIAKRAALKQTNPVLTNALKWGIKIIALDAALKWIQRELAKLPQNLNQAKNDVKNSSGTFKVKKLKSPYLKLESYTQQYRALQQQIDHWPFANVETPKGTCPFDGTTIGGERSKEERGDRIGLIPLEPYSINTPGDQKQSAHTPESSKKSQKKKKSIGGTNLVGGVRIVTAGDIRRRKEQKKLQEKKRGYCECCEVKYEDLLKHVREEQHKEFIRDKKNYADLDNLINTGPNEATFLHRVLQHHCSTAKQSSFKTTSYHKENQSEAKGNKKQVSFENKKGSQPTQIASEKTKQKSPRTIWKQTDESHHSKLSRDVVESDIRKCRQTRKSNEIDMKLEQHYVPTRTRNFLFVHRSPCQVSWQHNKGMDDNEHIHTSSNTEKLGHKTENIDVAITISKTVNKSQKRNTNVDNVNVHLTSCDNDSNEEIKQDNCKVIKDSETLTPENSKSPVIREKRYQVTKLSELPDFEQENKSVQEKCAKHEKVAKLKRSLKDQNCGESGEQERLHSDLVCNDRNSSENCDRKLRSPRRTVSNTEDRVRSVSPRKARKSQQIPYDSVGKEENELHIHSPGRIQVETKIESPNETRKCLNKQSILSPPVTWNGENEKFIKSPNKTRNCQNKLEEVNTVKLNSPKHKTCNSKSETENKLNLQIGTKVPYSCQKIDFKSKFKEQNEQTVDDPNEGRLSSGISCTDCYERLPSKCKLTISPSKTKTAHQVKTSPAVDSCKKIYPLRNSKSADDHIKNNNVDDIKRDEVRNTRSNKTGKECQLYRLDESKTSEMEKNNEQKGKSDRESEEISKVNSDCRETESENTGFSVNDATDETAKSRTFLRSDVQNLTVVGKCALKVKTDSPTNNRKSSTSLTSNTSTNEKDINKISQIKSSEECTENQRPLRSALKSNHVNISDSNHQFKKNEKFSKTTSKMSGEEAIHSPKNQRQSAIKSVHVLDSVKTCAASPSSDSCPKDKMLNKREVFSVKSSPCISSTSSCKLISNACPTVNQESVNDVFSNITTEMSKRRLRNSDVVSNEEEDEDLKQEINTVKKSVIKTEIIHRRQSLRKQDKKDTEESQQEMHMKNFDVATKNREKDLEKQILELNHQDVTRNNEKEILQNKASNVIINNKESTERSGNSRGQKMATKNDNSVLSPPCLSSPSFVHTFLSDFKTKTLQDKNNLDKQKKTEKQLNKSKNSDTEVNRNGNHQLEKRHESVVPVAINVASETPVTEQNIDISDVEKTINFIERVHRLRSMAHRCDSVDRELKDVSQRVSANSSRSNSPIRTEETLKNSNSNDTLKLNVFDSPVFKRTPLGNKNREKIISSPKNGISTPNSFAEKGHGGKKDCTNNTPITNKMSRWKAKRNLSCDCLSTTNTPVKRLEKLKYPSQDKEKSGKKNPEIMAPKNQMRERITCITTQEENTITESQDPNNSQQVIQDRGCKSSQPELTRNASCQQNKDTRNKQETGKQKKHQINKYQKKNFMELKKDRSKKILIMKKASVSPSVSKISGQRSFTPKKHSSPMIWKSAKGSTPKNRKKTVKLNKSWTLLSDRSVAKLFDDSDSESNFEGFEEADLTGHSSLGSDASFIEINEVELDDNSEREWALDSENDVDVRSTCEGREGVVDLNVYDCLPEMFSSPGKRSDSSWDDACVADFIETQISNKKSSVHCSPRMRSVNCSPRRYSPLKKVLMLQSPSRRKRLASVPEDDSAETGRKGSKRRKINSVDGFKSFMIDSENEQVDEEIQFNYSSPQRRKFSHKRVLQNQELPKPDQKADRSRRVIIQNKTHSKSTRHNLKDSQSELICDENSSETTMPILSPQSLNESSRRSLNLTQECDIPKLSPHDRVTNRKRKNSGPCQRTTRGKM